MGRIKLSPPVPCDDNTLDRVQKRLSDAITATIASPILDCQLVTVPLQALSSAQVVQVPHQLGRPAVGVVLASASIQVSAIGAQQALNTTQSVVTLTTPNPANGATATLLVF